jgi:hypothetical protein
MGAALMADENPDDLFRGPNDNGYEKGQMRVGPPLEYVAEKIRHGLEATHQLLADLRQGNDRETLLFSARFAFHSQLTGYLALNNLLALASDHALAQRLEGYSRQEFTEWSDRIEQQGSVT